MKTYLIDLPDHFNLYDLLESGQAFMYEKHKDGYLIITKGQRAFVKEDPENHKLTIRAKDQDGFNNMIHYFDLLHDYNKDYEDLKKIGFPADVLSFSSGIRILSQDIEEVIFTFIVSQNNNIKRIKKILNAIRNKVGKEKEDDYGKYHIFPTSEEIATLSLEELKEMGLGYRDKYIFETSRFLRDNKDFIENIKSMDTKNARKELMKLVGVGPKVADCILLFGYNKRDVFPLDTWMEKVFHERFEKEDVEQREKNRVKMARLAETEYKELSGLAQQLYFYHIRQFK